MGASLGLAGGLLMMVIAVHRSTGHFFDSYFNSYGFGPDQPDTTDLPIIVTGPGCYLAYVGVGLLAAAALTAGIWQRGWWQSRSAQPVPARTDTPADPAPVAGYRRGDGERELTVSALEPMDEHYFARPDRP
jgi:hypothetical protein